MLTEQSRITGSALAFDEVPPMHMRDDLADLIEAEALDSDFDAPGGDAYIHGLRRAVEIVRTGRRDR